MLYEVISDELGLPLFIPRTKTEKGNALNRKIFINSENPRGRRPVTCRITGKDP